MKWQITQAAFCLAVVFGSGCAQDSDSPQVTVRDHVAVFPSALKGPLDQSLPKYGAAEDVWISSDGVSRIAVVWERGTNHARMRADTTEAVKEERLRPFMTFVYAKDEEEKAKAADEYESTPTTQPTPETINDARFRLGEVEYARGELVAAAIIGPNGVEASDFLDDLASDSHRLNDLLRGLHHVGAAWQTHFYLGWNKGLYAVSLGDEGFGEPYKVMPKLDTLYDIWTQPDEHGTHVFWITQYAPPFELVMHADQLRDRLDHAYIEATSDVKESPLYRLDYNWGRRVEPIVVNCGGDRFDVFYERSTRPLLGDTSKDIHKDEIWYIPDILSNWFPSSQKIARYEHFCNKLHILPLPDDKIQLVWFEGSKDDQQGKCSRLMEAHLAGGRWSKKRQLCESATWQGTTLATAPIHLDGQDGVIAIWQDDEARLTYSLGFPRGTWSQPKTIELQIGEDSWLAPCGDRIALVTRIDGNLYWCFFDLRPEGTMDGGPGLASDAVGR